MGEATGEWEQPAAEICANNGCVVRRRNPDGGWSISDGKLGDESPVLTFDENETRAFRVAVAKEVLGDAALRDELEDYVRAGGSAFDRSVLL